MEASEERMVPLSGSRTTACKPFIHPARRQCLASHALPSSLTPPSLLTHVVAPSCRAGGGSRRSLRSTRRAEGRTSPATNHPAARSATTTTTTAIGRHRVRSLPATRQPGCAAAAAGFSWLVVTTTTQRSLPSTQTRTSTTTGGRSHEHHHGVVLLLRRRCRAHRTSCTYGIGWGGEHDERISVRTVNVAKGLGP